jgi:type IV pilus assembly protein PilV
MTRTAQVQHGFSLIEVLVTIVILAIGLLGLAGLQARAHTAEVESFARAKALMLANQMAERINSNLRGAKQGAASPYPLASIVSPYKTTTTFGTGHADGDCSAATTVAARDLCEWDLDLKGATEAVGSATTKVGGLADVRGCISTTVDTTGANLTGYVVQVAWQGRGSFGTSPAGLACGQGTIVPEASRRVIAVTVPIAALDQ